MARFGIEEEFMTLDLHTLAPVPKGAMARSALLDGGALSARSGSRISGSVSAEFLKCQVEVATSPSETLRAAGMELAGFRASLGEFARNTDLIVASVGTPYGAAKTSAVTPKQRYQAIADLMGGLAREHFVNGMHVHTEVCDPEDRVRALNAVRPWLPALLALTANSPFWRGRPTGFASWRSILLRRLPTMWCPPVFRDVDDYQRRLERLIRLDAAVDRSAIAWAARVSDHYDTVEVRVFDAQLTVEETLLAAAMTRALIAEPPSTIHLESEAIDGSLWMAARAGMRAQLTDPVTGEVAPAWSVVQGMLDVIRNSLIAHDDDAFVEERITFVREMGTGADRQLDAVSQHGIAGLRALLTNWSHSA